MVSALQKHLPKQRNQFPPEIDFRRKWSFRSNLLDDKHHKNWLTIFDFHHGTFLQVLEPIRRREGRWPTKNVTCPTICSDTHLLDVKPIYYEPYIWYNIWHEAHVSESRYLVTRTLQAKDFGTWSDNGTTSLELLGCDLRTWNQQVEWRGWRICYPWWAQQKWAQNFDMYTTIVTFLFRRDGYFFLGALKLCWLRGEVSLNSQWPGLRMQS